MIERWLQYLKIAAIVTMILLLGAGTLMGGAAAAVALWPSAWLLGIGALAIIWTVGGATVALIVTELVRRYDL